MVGLPEDGCFADSWGDVPGAALAKLAKRNQSQPPLFLLECDIRQKQSDKRMLVVVFLRALYQALGSTDLVVLEMDLGHVYQGCEVVFVELKGVSKKSCCQREPSQVVSRDAGTCKRDRAVFGFCSLEGM